MRVILLSFGVLFIIGICHHLYQTKRVNMDLFHNNAQRNLVIITSVIKISSQPLSYSSVRSKHTWQERLADTLKTIDSIKQHIPNVFIVLIEGSKIDDDTANLLMKRGCNHIHYVPEQLKHVVDGAHKSVGEVMMILNYLETLTPPEVTKFDTFSKISGRYYLTNNFVWEKHPHDKALYQCETDGRCNTRYYMIPVKYLDVYKATLQAALLDKDFIEGRTDIEGYNIFRNIPNYTKIVRGHDMLGVQGYIAPTNELVEDFTPARLF
jgi:hypothetical protein